MGLDRITKGNKITDPKKKLAGKFFAFNGSDMFITMYTTAQH